jgi:hypothetical protein
MIRARGNQAGYLLRYLNLLLRPLLPAIVRVFRQPAIIAIVHVGSAPHIVADHRAGRAFTPCRSSPLSDQPAAAGRSSTTTSRASGSRSGLVENLAQVVMSSRRFPNNDPRA